MSVDLRTVLETAVFGCSRVMNDRDVVQRLNNDYTILSNARLTSSPL